MNKLSALSEYLKDKLPSIDIEDAKKVIRAYEKFWFDYRSNFCGVCQQRLTSAELEARSSFDFTHTCFEHKEYRNHFRLELIQEKLGITPFNLYDINELDKNI